MKYCRLLSCLCLIFVARTALAQDAGGEPVMVERIVAVVNDEVVLHSELQHTVKQLVTRLEGEMALPPRDVIEEQVLERLILTELQLQLASGNGVQVSANQVDDALQRVAGNNNMTLAQLRERVIADGFSFTAFRNDIRNQLILQTLQERVIEARVQVSDSEVDIQLAKLPDSSQAYLLATILIAVPEGASPNEIQRSADQVANLYREIRAGRTFAEAAIAESDAQNALQGGDLGWRRAEEIPPDFIELVEELQVGEVSPPTRAPGGFYLLKLQDTRQAQPVIVQEKLARHILITPDEITSDQEAYQLIVDLRERIVEQGADFADLARQYSDDITNAAQGGDLGWFGPVGYGTRFDEVLAKLEPDEVSQPFRTGGGWHIIQLLGRRQSDRTEELRAQRAREALYQRKRDEQIEAWLRQMRDQAYVDIRL